MSSVSGFSRSSERLRCVRRTPSFCVGVPEVRRLWIRRTLNSDNDDPELRMSSVLNALHSNYVCIRIQKNVSVPGRFPVSGILFFV